jgi:hypothetical protein
MTRGLRSPVVFLGMTRSRRGGCVVLRCGRWVRRFGAEDTECDVVHSEADDDDQYDEYLQYVC